MAPRDHTASTWQNQGWVQACLVALREAPQPRPASSLLLNTWALSFLRLPAAPCLVGQCDSDSLPGRAGRNVNHAPVGLSAEGTSRQSPAPPAL